MPQSPPNDAASRETRDVPAPGPDGSPAGLPLHDPTWLSPVSLDVAAFSSALPAVIAVGLSLAASQAFETPDATRWAVLAASGTFVVYGLDRLRDTTRDRSTSPRRTAFIERHARVLRLAVAVAALVVGAILVAAPTDVTLLCAAVGAIGLLHRRLKGYSALKCTYVSAAWVAICAGVPGLGGANFPTLLWVIAIYFAALAANLTASNLVDDHSRLIQRDVLPPLIAARTLAITGVAIAWIAPAGLTPLGWIPLFEALSLLAFRPGEYYGHLVVDGALLAGALASLTHFALLPTG